MSRDAEADSIAYASGEHYSCPHGVPHPHSPGACPHCDSEPITHVYADTDASPAAIYAATDTDSNPLTHPLADALRESLRDAHARRTRAHARTLRSRRRV